MKKGRCSGKIFVLLGGLLFSQQSISAIDFLRSSKLHFIGQGTYASYNLGTTRISELGMRPMVIFFPLSRMAFFGGYSTAVNMEGRSNFNGIDLGTRIYPLGLGSQTDLNAHGTSIFSYSVWAYYVGLEFQNRQFKYNQNTLDLSGFAYSAGLDWHLDRKWFLNGEVSYGVLNNSLGSNRVQQVKAFTTSLGIGVVF